MTAISCPALRRPAATVPKRAIALATAVGGRLYVAFAGTATQPHDQNHPLFLALNDARDWVRDNRQNAVFVLLLTGPTRGDGQRSSKDSPARSPRSAGRGSRP